MANPNGIVNGTNVLLKTYVSGVQTVIGGLKANSQTYNAELIDITNKSSGQFRSLLEGEGELNADHTCDVLFSSDAAYLTMRARYDAKTIDKYIVDYGDKSEEYEFAVTSLADNVSKNEAVTSSITLTSSGDISGLDEEFNFVVTDNGGSNFVVTDNGGSNFVVTG